MVVVNKDEWENTVEWNDKWFGLCYFNESGELAKKKKGNCKDYAKYYC